MRKRQFKIWINAISIFLLLMGILVNVNGVFALDYYACSQIKAKAKECVTIDKIKSVDTEGNQIFENNSCIKFSSELECKDSLPRSFCYDNSNPINSKCFTSSELISNSGDDFLCTDLMEKSQCEAKLSTLLADIQKKQGPVCCIPSDTAMKKGIVCQDITADYSSAELVDSLCANALGGDSNYVKKYDGKCSKAASCKGKIGTGKSNPGFSVEGSGSPAGSAKIEGGTFNIPDLVEPIPGITVQELIGRIISGALSVVGTVAFAFFIYGGIMWMTASGNEEQTRTATKIMIWTVLGLAVIFSSYVLVRFVLDILK